MLTTIPETTSARLFDELERANARVMAHFPGEPPHRQPVHVVYGGAHLFTASAIVKLGAIARATLEKYAAGPDLLAAALGIDPALAAAHLPASRGKAGAGAGRRLPDRLRRRLRQSPRRRGGSLRRVDGTRGRGGREERNAIPGHRHPHQAAGRGAQTPKPAHLRSVSHRAPRCQRRHAAAELRGHATENYRSGTGRRPGLSVRRVRIGASHPGRDAAFRADGRNDTIHRRPRRRDRVAAARRRRPRADRRRAFRHLRLHGVGQHHCGAPGHDASGVRLREAGDAGRACRHGHLAVGRSDQYHAGGAASRGSRPVN